MEARLRMIKLTSMLVAAVLLSSPAFAASNSNTKGNSANAPGQQIALANCIANILKQNANGQTGANTGSGNDKKQLDTAVTNCDHFWDDPLLPRPISAP